MRKIKLHKLCIDNGRCFHSGKQKHHPFRVYEFEKMNYRQDFNQKLYTYPKQVLSCVLNPDLISNETINQDARMRAQSILDIIISAGSYSQSAGFAFIRKSVCEYIARVDCVSEPNINNIILIDGISQGLHLIIRSIITKSSDAVMVPTPRYPFYTANISQNLGQAVAYELKQNEKWQINKDELMERYQIAQKDGKEIKAIIISNPHNPTGTKLSIESITSLLTFAVNNRLLVVADQGFADPLRKENATFSSCRKVLQTLKPQIRDNCQLVSFYSVSKGLLMQGGYRGGYLSLHNIEPAVHKQLSKFQTFYGCSGVMGQLMVELIVNPYSHASFQTKTTLEKQHSSLLNQLKQNGQLLKKELSEMTNVHCDLEEQGIYAYPSINFSMKAILVAEQKGMKIDEYYCHEMLKNTGTALVPGTYFAQSSSSHHFRISPLILPSQQLRKFLSKLKESNQAFHRQLQH